MTARDDLDRALIGLAEQGARPRCSEPVDKHLWTSDDLDDRHRAALLCTGCQVADYCHTAAVELDPTAGVWAGRDWSHTPGRRRTTPPPLTTTKESA